MSLIRRVVALAVGVAGLGCERSDTPRDAPAAPGATAAVADSAAVEALYRQLVATGQAGDADAYAALFLNHGAIATPNEPAAAGQTALRAWARRFYERWKVEIDTFANEDRRIGGSVGYSRYRVTGRYVPRSGGPAVPFDQKYVDTFAKDSAGRWKFGVHMLNSNNRAAGIWD